ncbi:acyltransferase family protein [Rhodoblastus sp.]|uniref:acyltransferase family protein n=1 Tax=Rhodoblastus sp. TaxID=1962975 RepID=UPI003F9DF6A7
MRIEKPPTGRRDNNFGAARLILAMMVILSHSPELIDGDRSREPLTQLFPGTSFGSLGVAGFFLISGYLITQSFLSSTTTEYLAKRILRIFPGFAVAFLISLLIVGPLGGGRLGDDPSLWAVNLKRLVLLQQPLLPTAFVGTHYPALNGSMWSIGYEFRCYIIVLLIGVAGAFARRNLVLAGTSALVAAAVLAGEALVVWPHHLDGFIGVAGVDLNLIGVFACGVCFFLYRERIAFRPLSYVIAAFALVIGLRIPQLATVAIETAGAYLLFAFIFALKNDRLASVGSHTDLSYGVYLYAFPIQRLLIQWNPNISPIALTLLAALASVACAYLSWTLVEKPALAVRAEWRRRCEISAALASK